MVIHTFSGMKVLVTGASAGLGQEFARIFAEDGADVILLARRENRLEMISEQLNQQYGERVTFLAADLSRPETADEVYDLLKKEEVAPDVLINNAGFGINRSLEASDPNRVRDLLRVNVESLVRLTGLFLPHMIENKRGAILNVASTAAFQPLPYHGVYAASKAFVLSFSEALHQEVKEKGVTVTCLCPGPTATEFFEAGGYSMGTKFLRPGLMPVEKAAQVGFQALRRGQMTVIPGFLNNLIAFGVRFFPRSIVAAMARVIGGE